MDNSGARPLGKGTRGGCGSARRVYAVPQWRGGGIGWGSTLPSRVIGLNFATPFVFARSAADPDLRFGETTLVVVWCFVARCISSVRLKAAVSPDSRVAIRFWISNIRRIPMPNCGGGGPAARRCPWRLLIRVEAEALQASVKDDGR